MSNCTIYNKSFLDDIIDKKSSIENASVRLDVLTTLINNIAHSDNIWTPLFINNSNTSIDETKIINQGYVSGYRDDISDTLGIQNFLTIDNPLFDFWTVINGSMKTDWFLNRPNSSIIPIYGLMLWFKKITPLSHIPQPINFYPNNSRITLVGTNRSFIKVDNNILYELNNINKNSSRFNNSGTINFSYNENNDSNNFVDIAIFGNNPLFVPSSIKNKENRSNVEMTTSSVFEDSNIIINGNKYLFYLAPGDVYSYRINLDEFMSDSNSIAPRSFCSAALYSIYNNIYHKITSHIKKTANYRKTHESRVYKNIAKYLATSPYNDEFSINRLSDIFSNYETSALSLRYSNTNDIISILTSLSIELQNSISGNGIENIIYDINDLKFKIVNKYGSRLCSTGDMIISSKNELENKENVVINQIAEYWLPKDISNQTIFANQEIRIGNTKFNTRFGEKLSSLRIRTGTRYETVELFHLQDIDLWDGIKPIIKSDPNNNLNLVLERSTNNTDLDEYNDPEFFNSPNTVVFKYLTRGFPNRGDGAFLDDQIKLKILPDNLAIDEYREYRDPFNPADILVKKDFICTWEKISGPPLLFIHSGKINFPPRGGGQIFWREERKILTDYVGEKIGFDKLTYESEVYVVPSRTGRYQVKCTINSPYGVFVKIKTFYVTYGRSITFENSSGRQEGVPIGSFMEDYLLDVPQLSFLLAGNIISSIRRYIFPDASDINYTKNRERHSILINPKNLRIHVPLFNKIALNDRGFCLPINTNLSIKNPFGREPPQKLLGNDYYYVADYYDPPSDPSKINNRLNIKYELGSTIYKIDQIILEKTRNKDNPSSYNCQSLYLPQLYGRGGAFTRSKGGYVGPNIDRYLDTDNSPPIKAYGGYDRSILETIGISIPNHPDPGTIFPPVTGRPLNYRADNPASEDPPHYDSHKYCIENIVDQPDNYLNFEKGVFHPSIGWIPYNSPLYSEYRNTSSVLKFNPGARDSFSFTGPSINNITNESYIFVNNNLYIIPQTYKSNIELGVIENAQTIQETTNCSDSFPCRPDSPPEWDWKNQLHRESADQYMVEDVLGGEAYTHGYRILGGGEPKLVELNINNKQPIMDEFGFGLFSDHQDFDTFVYKFATNGPAYAIEPIPDFVTEYLEKIKGLSPNCVDQRNALGARPPDPNYYKGIPNPVGVWRGLRDLRVLNFSIKDIEVKLNFLNYVNTKDLSIVFESLPPPDETNRIRPNCSSRINSPINAGNIFIDETISSIFDGPEYLFTEQAIGSLPGGIPLWTPGQEYTANTSEDRFKININNKSLKNYLQALSITNTRYITGSQIYSNNNPIRNSFVNDIKQHSFSSSNVIRDSAGPLPLYLLNQEYVQNHSFNLSLKFSDHTNKFNVLNDQSYIKDNIHSNYQNIVAHNGVTGPSISPFGYNDKDIILNHKLKLNNKLNIINNSFAKYSGKTLFNSTPPCPCGAGAGGKTTKTPNKNGTTKFSCIITVYDEHDEMSPIDYTKDSQLFTNAYDYSGKINTTNFFNSLCSWELLLHVGDSIKPTAPMLAGLDSYGNNESLSLIDYGKKPKYAGYSFIANLKRFKHLLPFVNINAPNVFFQDYNVCSVGDLEEYGKFGGGKSVEFPWLAILNATNLYMGAIGLAGAGGVVGLTAGIGLSESISNIVYAEFGRFFSDRRTQDFRQNVMNDIYHQDYTRYPFGSPEKILINFSKDDIFWYKAEASIFKYENTPILPYKRYNYIRLNPDSFPSLSRFEFELVKNLNDLIDDRYIKSLSVGTADPFECNPAGSFFKDGVLYNLYDIVNVTFTENETCLNGLYIAMPESWIRLQDNEHLLGYNQEYISENHILYNKSENIETDIFHNFSTYAGNNNIIILKGSIPYEIFNLNDTILVRGDNIEPDSTENNNEPTSNDISGPVDGIDEPPPPPPNSDSQTQSPQYTARVLSKGLIYKDNEAYSILKLSRDMKDVDFISPNNNVVVLFSLDSSSDFKNSPLNYQPFEKENINFNHTPEIFLTTNSFGSYGDGSIKINKNLLQYIPTYNNLNKIYNKLNSGKNDKIKTEKMLFSTTNNQVEELKSVGGSMCYFHTIKDIKKYITNINQYKIENNVNIDIINSLETILEKPSSSILNNIESNYHFAYIKNNSFKNSNTIDSDFGYAYIENDYEVSVPVKAVDENGNEISDNLFRDLINRLNLLEDLTENEEIASAIGRIERTNFIIGTYNLFYIFQHYESLVEYNQTKQRTEFALKTFFKQRDDILKLLNEISLYQTANITLISEDDTVISGQIISENSEQITIVDSNNIKTSINKENIKNIIRDFVRNNNKIRPKKNAIISIKTGTNSVFSWLSNIVVYDIIYEDNNDDYWINLDPHQSCSIAEELRPKVLKKISYVCRPTNYAETIFGTPLLAANNICARMRGAILQERGPEAVLNPDSINFRTESIQPKPMRGGRFETYSYIIGDNIVNRNKESIENKATGAGLPIQWKEIMVTRNYHINGEGLGGVYNNSEIMVAVFETYDVLLAPNEINSPTNGLDADTLVLENFSSGDRFGGASSPSQSPGGIGLLNSFGGRIGYPVKIYNVCNLDNQNNLKIKIRKIPRQIRGLDLLGTVYRYGASKAFRPPAGRPRLEDPLTPSEPLNIGPVNDQPMMNNNLYYWKCLEVDSSTKTLIDTTTPLFFQLMNEMTFRAFYGSVDRIENKQDNMVSQFPWEMIPYEP